MQHNEAAGNALGVDVLKGDTKQKRITGRVSGNETTPKNIKTD